MDTTKFKGHIFDMDGTLIRSNGVWAKIDEEFLGKRGFDVPEDYYKNVSTMNFDAAAKYTKKRFNLPENTDEIRLEWFNSAVFQYTNVIKLIEGAGEYLEKLKSDGAKIAIATASSESLYIPVLKNNGIYDYFDCFASTEEVSRGKGFPDVYELACQRLELSPENCIVYEDIIDGIRGAKAGGFAAAACLGDHMTNDFDLMKNESDIWYYTYEQMVVKV